MTIDRMVSNFRSLRTRIPGHCEPVRFPGVAISIFRSNAAAMTREIPTKAGALVRNDTLIDLQPAVRGSFPPPTSGSLRTSPQTIVAISIFRRTRSHNSGHCEPVLRLVWQSPSIEESGLDDEGDSHESRHRSLARHDTNFEKWPAVRIYPS